LARRGGVAEVVEGDVAPGAGAELSEELEEDFPCGALVGGMEEGVEVIGDAGGEGFEEAVVAHVHGEDGDEVGVVVDDEKAEAAGLGLGLEDGVLPGRGVESGGRRGLREELFPGGEEVGVGGPVVVADGAEAGVVEGFVPAVEAAGEELAPGALEVRQWGGGGGH
jgi:hypothetical protein